MSKPYTAYKICLILCLLVLIITSFILCIVRQNYKMLKNTTESNYKMLKKNIKKSDFKCIQTYRDPRVIDIESKIDVVRNSIDIQKEQMIFLTETLTEINSSNSAVFNDINITHSLLNRKLIPHENEINLSEYSSIPDMSTIPGYMSTESILEDGKTDPSSVGAIRELPPIITRDITNIDTYIYSLNKILDRTKIDNDNLRIHIERINLRIFNGRVKNCRLNLRLHKLMNISNKNNKIENLSECSLEAIDMFYNKNKICMRV